MNNYPDTTWQDDPLAPWNEPDAWEGQICEDCKYCTDAHGGLICIIGIILEQELCVEEVRASSEACELFKQKG